MCSTLTGDNSKEVEENRRKLEIRRTGVVVHRHVLIDKFHDEPGDERSAKH